MQSDKEPKCLDPTRGTARTQQKRVDGAVEAMRSVDMTGSATRVEGEHSAARGPLG